MRCVTQLNRQMRRTCADGPPPTAVATVASTHHDRSSGVSRERTAKREGASESERVDQRLKRRRLMASARVVKEVAVERRAPVFKHPHEPAARYVFGHVFLEQESQSQSVQRSTERERGIAEDEGSRDGHSDGLGPLLELPSVDGAAAADAVAVPGAPRACLSSG